MKEIRAKVLQMVNTYAEGTFVAILDKESIRYQTWTEERIGNYVIGHTLINNILSAISIDPYPSIYYDEGRLSIKRTKDFERYLEFKAGCQLNRCSLNSLAESLIWAADIVAGAYYYEFARGCDFYSKVLTRKIGIGLRKYW